MELPQLTIENLSCGRGERALFDGLDVTLRAGQAARVLGDNGSGKTTLLRTIAGLQRPLAGRVHWRGAAEDDPHDPPLFESSLCFVGHDNALNGALSPVENLDVLMRLADRFTAESVIRDTLASLGLGHIADRSCERLSAGQKRRVSLARLWLTGARLWLLDEPASALDVDARTDLCKRMAAHVHDGGLVIFTTHEALELQGVSVRSIALRPC